jgi:redox-sensing transcriptional repressor
MLGISDAQIRKDISNFGKVGTPRVGYNIQELLRTLEELVLKKETINVIILGAGNIGTALLKYSWKRRANLEIIAAFDSNKRKIGKKINSIPVYATDAIESVIKKNRIDLAVLTVPENSSQEIANSIVAAGIKRIINFTPVTLHVPAEVSVKNIDLSIEFLSLYFNSILSKR